MTEPRPTHDDVPSPELLEAWRDLTPEDFERTPPPEQLWTAIEGSLSENPTAEMAPPRPGDDGIAGAAVVTLDSRRPGRRPRLMLGAVAAALVAVVGGLALWAQGDDARVVAEVAITSDGLPLEAPAPATARLVEEDGYRLELDLPDLPEVDGAYEVWIIDTEVNEMYSLGVATGSGEFALPAGVDPTAFPVVDISVEPFDGDPTHSGQSILRGVLEL